MIATVESPAANAPVETSTLDRVAELQKTISASRWTLWLQCRLKFFFRYVLLIQKPPTPSMHAGSTVHAVLQQWNMDRWRREPFSIEWFKTFFGAQWASLQESMKINWEGDEESDRNSAWRALQLYFIRTPIKNNEKPQAAEVRVEADLARHGLPKLIGIIDLVRADGRIVDFKLVGRTPDSEQLVHVNEAQLTCYSLLYRDATGSNESGLELHHLVRTKLPKLIVTTLPVSTESQKTRLFRKSNRFRPAWHARTLFLHLESTAPVANTSTNAVNTSPVRKEVYGEAVQQSADGAWFQATGARVYDVETERVKGLAKRQAGKLRYCQISY